MHTVLRPVQPANRPTRVFSICREAYVGKPCRTPRETVYWPGMCSSPTSPDSVAHKPHVLSIRPSRSGLDAGTSRSEGFSHPANTSGIQGARSSASTTLKMALSSRRASQRGVGRRWRTSLAMVQGVFHLLQAVSQELQKSEHILMPHEHRNTAQVAATLPPRQLPIISA